MSTRDYLILVYKHTADRYLIAVIERLSRLNESFTHELGRHCDLVLLKILDDVVVDVPALSLIHPVLIVDCARARMWNEFAVDRFADLTLLLQIFDTIVCVAANTDDDAGLKHFDGLSQILNTDFRQLRFGFALL